MVAARPAAPPGGGFQGHTQPSLQQHGMMHAVPAGGPSTGGMMAAANHAGGPLRQPPTNHFAAARPHNAAAMAAMSPVSRGMIQHPSAAGASHLRSPPMGVATPPGQQMMMLNQRQQQQQQQTVQMQQLVSGFAGNINLYSSQRQQTVKTDRDTIQ